ncbi:uncharacterized protein LOC126368371 isoform X2 [Pectinophora gossypiella]|uniref:uncharacterized protein LOC126368371 isoform X2 n=1 Tax=Pectinophora gossypiella TaxID=13191 RepID=UPI00214E6F18|nr:uncharacterized protein LOC126368371 isoform X2 [Pectinophora gossypiella]
METDLSSGKQIDHISTLNRQRGSLKSSITKLYNQLKDTTSEPQLTREALLVKEERLRNLFSRYEECNFQIMGFDPSDKEDSDVVESKYLHTLTIIKQLTSLSLSNESQSQNSSRHYVPTKLPEITVPPFTGKYSDYRTFMCLFNSMVHDNIHLQEIQKLYYLRTFLWGEPLDLIKMLPMVSESYAESLQILNDRYNNEYKIRNEHISMLLDIPQVSRSTAHHIRQFISIVKQQLAALKNLNCNVQEWDPIILCVLLRKLDFLCNREFQLVRSVDTPTVQCLITFLEKRALALENSERPSSLHEKQTASARMVAAAVKSQSPAVKDQPPAVKDQRPAADPVITKPQPSCLFCVTAT